MEKRRRLPYIGRARAVGREGVIKPIDPRALARPHYAIRWTAALQTAAVDRGWFVARDMGDNHARIVVIHPRGRTDADVINELERTAFTEPPTSPSYLFARTALAFIEQQDSYGWTGAWEISVQTYSPQLRWYKERKAFEQAAAMARRKRVRV